jgi:hypothetical protein
MLSWKYTTDFDKQNHLFHNAIDTNYIIEAFSCSCGKVDFIIKYSYQTIDYICPICENKTFYNANEALIYIKSFVKNNKIINENYKIEYEEQEILTIWMKRFSINKISEIAA